MHGHSETTEKHEFPTREKSLCPCFFMLITTRHHKFEISVYLKTQALSSQEWRMEDGGKKASKFWSRGLAQLEATGSSEREG